MLGSEIWFTLLLGNSGTGKTSLIHAGLISEAIKTDWFPVYTRPLGLPRTDVVAGLVSTVFEGPQSYRDALLGALDDAAAATAPKRVLLIFDQFEDILSSMEDREAERLFDDLRVVRFIDDSRDFLPDPEAALFATCWSDATGTLLFLVLGKLLDVARSRQPRMFMKVRLATAARPDDRHEFTAMNFDGDSVERMHPRLAQFVILVRALSTNNGARGSPETWF